MKKISRKWLKPNFLFTGWTVRQWDRSVFRWPGDSEASGVTDPAPEFHVSSVSTFHQVRFKPFARQNPEWQEWVEPPAYALETLPLGWNVDATIVIKFAPLPAAPHDSSGKLSLWETCLHERVADNGTVERDCLRWQSQQPDNKSRAGRVTC